MTKRELQEQFIIEVCKENIKLGCTEPELDLRYNLAQSFNIKLDWAYQLIRDICKNNPHLHLEKIEVQGFGNTKWEEYEVTWKD